MVTEAQIRDQLANYLAGDIDLDSFDEWITRETWDVHQSGDDAAQRLVAEIELVLAEHSAGHVTDARLYERLMALLSRYATIADLSNALAEALRTTTTTTTESHALSIAA